MKNIVAIVGSLRAESFNRQVAQAAGTYLEGKAEFSIIDYADVPLMNQDIEFPAPAAVARIRQTVKDADGVWIFTPEYNHAVPGVLKNLIDWLSRPISGTEPQVLVGKPVAISGITPGMSGTLIAQDQLIAILSFLQADIMNAPRLTIPNCLGLMKDGKLDLGESAPYLAKQADAFLAYLG